MRILLLLFAILFSVVAFGQKQMPYDSISNKIVFKEIVSFDTSMNADKIYKAAKEWLESDSRTFNRSNSDKNYSGSDIFLGTQRGNSVHVDQLYKNDTPLKSEDGSEHRLIGKCVLKYTGSSMGCLRVLYVQFDIRISSKDSRAKIETLNFQYTHYNQMKMKQSQLIGWSDKGPCSSKNNMEELLQCDKCDKELNTFYDFIVSDQAKLFSQFKAHISASKGADNDW